MRAGNHLKVAAQFAGIGESTLKSWMARGRLAAAAQNDGQPVPPEDEPYLAFLAAVSEADTRAEVAAVAAWRSKFADDWRAARDFLRASRPDRWAPTQRVQLTTEEAEARTDRAVWEVLTSLGIDTPEPGTPLPDLGTPDPATAALIAELEGDDGPD